MTDSERVAVKDYIDARITPIVQDLGRIERKLDGLFTKLDGVQAVDDRASGAESMKRTIWKASAAVATFVTALTAVVVGIVT